MKIEALRNNAFDQQGWPHLLFVGDWRLFIEIVMPLYQNGYSITFVHTVEEVEFRPSPTHTLLILSLTPDVLLDRIASFTQKAGWPWIACNRSDHADLTLAAYQAGARAVLPSSLNAAILEHTLSHSMDVRSGYVLHEKQKQHLCEQRKYHVDEYIRLDQETVLEVCQGIVALTVLHPDGTQVLLGLCGSGQVLVGHPEDECCIQVIAHTETTVILRTWSEALKMPDIAVRLRSRLRFMEAWASTQARPYLDQRLLGIFSLLAEQFGVPHQQGTLIDLRLTHAQLASTVGATRTTVTRLLGKLRRQGLLFTTGSGGSERFCLPIFTPRSHLL